MISVEEREGFLVLKIQGEGLNLESLEKIKGQVNDAIRKSINPSFLAAILLIDDLFLQCALAHYLSARCSLEAIAIPNSSKTIATVVTRNTLNKEAVMQVGSTIPIGHLF